VLVKLDSQAMLQVTVQISMSAWVHIRAMRVPPATIQLAVTVAVVVMGSNRMERIVMT
jgi:hypothetical protein